METIGRVVVERDPSQKVFDFVRDVIVLMTAMDRPREEIREVLREHNVDVSLEEISLVQEREADAVRKMRAELQLRLRSIRERYDLAEKLASIVHDIEAILEKVKASNRYRDFTQLVPSLLKAIDMLTKAMEQNADDVQFSDEELARIDYEFVKHLEELGYVEVKDEEGLIDYLRRGVDYELLAVRAYQQWQATAPEVDSGEAG